ncbi:hypothetical protein [Achromobacter xylosoxidans]
MNTISASAPPARIHPQRIVAKAARKLGDFIAPRDHAGKGNWSKDSDIPAAAWLGAAALAFVWLVVLPWLGRASGF